MISLFSLYFCTNTHKPNRLYIFRCLDYKSKTSRFVNEFNFVCINFYVSILPHFVVQDLHHDIGGHLKSENIIFFQSPFSPMYTELTEISPVSGKILVYISWFRMFIKLFLGSSLPKSYIL